MRRALLSFVLALSSMGCGNHYRADLGTICDAPLRVTVRPGEDPGEKAAAIGSYVSAHLRTDRGKQFFATLAQLPPASQAETLRREAAAHGLTSCALADIWQP